MTATVDDRIVMTDLVKRYGTRTVVKSVSADVRRGEVVGLLGPNGAGKTTTFYMVVGLVRPDGGNVALVRAGASGVAAPASAISLKRIRSSANFRSATTCV